MSFMQMRTLLKIGIHGKYAFQILTSTGLLEEGQLKVKTNLLYADEFGSFWKKALHQIDELIAGKTLNAADAVTVR